MSSRTRLALGLLGSALFLGLLGDELLRATPVGLNLFLWIVAIVAVLLVLSRWQRAPLAGGRRWMLPVLVIFAGLVVWRDSPWLVSLDIFAIVVALALGSLRTPRPVHRAGLTDYLVGLGHAGAAAGGRTVTLMQRDIDWQELPKGTQAKQAVAVGRGLMLAAPLLLLFGALFVAADSVFQDYVSSAVPNPDELLTHVLLVAVFAWVSGGLLREYIFKPKTLELNVEPKRTLGGTELTVVLALLDLLFLAFVLVQLRYLFGGQSLVETRTSLTYAEYARHGFFELVAVAALVLPLLLHRGLDAQTRPGTPGRPLPNPGWRADHSALRRHGLGAATHAPLSAGVRAHRAPGVRDGAMIWLAVVFVWAAATVLRGRRQLFAVGALVSGFAAILAINVVNPDALIARTNLDRARLDLPYVMNLSDDATPELVKALPTLEPAQREQLAAELASRRQSSDWRTWNWSRYRAQQELRKVTP